MRVDYTKQLIANSLMELMKQDNFDSISVKDIINHCNISRHTFYYHFEDKYSLIKWIFYQYAEMDFPTPTSEEVANGRVFYIREIINHMYHHKHFYINLFNSSAADHVNDYLFSHVVNYRDIQIDGLLKGRQISIDGRRFIATYYTCAITGMITRWAKGGMTDPIEVFFKDYQDVALQSIASLIEKYAV